MKLPVGYPDALSAILDAHTSAGLVPGWYALHFQDIGADLRAAIERFFPEARSLLDLGGRSLPYLYGQNGAYACSYVPVSASYAKAVHTLGFAAKIADTPDTLLEKKADLLLLNLEIGGTEPSFEKDLAARALQAGIPVLAYAYNVPPARAGAPCLDFLDDGRVFDPVALAAQRTMIVRDTPEYAFKTITTYVMPP